MHRHWQHDVSQDWLLMRKGYLCASEIGRLAKDARRVLDEKLKLMDSAVFRDVIADKLSSDFDERSYGAAARGHIMEPEAVAWWNSTMAETQGRMYHWDDCLLTSGVVAFSPDAMNVPQPEGITVTFPTEGMTSVMEIKSYSSAQHLKRLVQHSQDPMSLPELWQLATAMYVCPKVTVARLLMWAPQLDDVHVFEYAREDLADMVREIEYIEDLYVEARQSYEEVLSDGRFPERSEGEIYNQYLATLV